MAEAQTKAKQSADNLVLLNMAQAEMSTEQELDLIGDYDQAYEEWRSKNKPFEIKFEGKVYKIPRTQPIAYALFVSRYCIKKVNQGGRYVTSVVVPDDKAYEYARLMFGDEFVAALSKSRVEIGFVMERIAPDIHRKWEGERTKQEGKNALTPGS